MRENKSYVFFQELTGAGPLGALGLPVTPRATVAADPKFVPLGAPVLLRLDRPEANGLWIAQDTGGAIKGANRFDTFWGAGAEAARIAGGMQGQGRAWLLVPKGHAWLGSMRRLGPDEAKLWAKVVEIGAAARRLRRSRAGARGGAAAACGGAAAIRTAPASRPQASRRDARLRLGPPSRPRPGLARRDARPSRPQPRHRLRPARPPAGGGDPPRGEADAARHRQAAGREGPAKRGAIRAAVGDWLHASRHAGSIAAVRGAHPRHGGAGALYIVLRRRRP